MDRLVLELKTESKWTSIPVVANDVRVVIVTVVVAVVNDVDDAHNVSAKT